MDRYFKISPGGAWGRQQKLPSVTKQFKPLLDKVASHKNSKESNHLLSFICILQKKIIFKQVSFAIVFGKLVTIGVEQFQKVIKK